MSDMKKAFEQAGIKERGKGVMTKPCKECGNEFTPREPHHIFCADCIKKRRAEASKSVKVSEGLPSDYLKDGYFDTNNCIFEKLITTLADNIALSFYQAYPRMKNHQLRRFYQHVKAAENRLKMIGDWPSVNIDIKKLKPFVAEAKAKGKVPAVFYDFMIANVDAVRDENSFRKGFLEHFQAVMAYFTYYNPKD